jgi:hypothetical protein
VLYLCLPHLRNDFPRIAGPNFQLVAFLTFSATSGPCSSLQDLRGGTSQNDTTASKHATTQASCAARRYRKESPGAPPRCINTVSAPKRTRGFRSRLSRSPPSPPRERPRSYVGALSVASKAYSVPRSPPPARLLAFIFGHLTLFTRLRGRGILRRWDEKADPPGAQYP